MWVVGYLRVSTDRQAEEGLGLEVQEEAIRTWAREHGHRVRAWFNDSGLSGGNGLDTRVALADALDAVRQGQAAGLVVYRLDRLARDLVLQEQLLQELRHLGGAAFSCSPGEAGYLVDDPDDPSRRLIRQVLGAVNEYERSMIKLRLRSGRRHKHERGGYAYGAPAYGYRARDKELLPDADEGRAIARMRELRQAGTSLRTIGQTLDAEGHRPRRGARWQPTAINRILAREAAGIG